MYLDLNIKDTILNKIVAEMKADYLKSLNIEIPDGEDVKITYADLTVWLYNRDCQTALSEIKHVWNQVNSNKLGTKSL